MREFELISSFFAPLAQGFEGSLGLKDDAALLRLAQGQELVVTTDAICEGVHFIGHEDAALIAKKLLRVNLSDLAAKGAEPLCYMLSLMLPEGTPDEWVRRFAQGLVEDQALFPIALAGGDTVATKGPFGASVTAMGTVALGRMIRRAGAKVGHRVYVTGTLGDSAMGLALLQERLVVEAGAQSLWLKERYYLPQPRLEAGRALVGVASAGMDISDGLVQDLGHICAASGVGAVLHRHLLPLSDAARAVLDRQPEYWDAVLGGGDDYELLFTAPGSAVEAIAALAAKLPMPITAIGEITPGSGVSVLDEHGGDVTPVKGGYSHKV